MKAPPPEGVLISIYHQNFRSISPITMKKWQYQNIAIISRMLTISPYHHHNVDNIAITPIFSLNITYRLIFRRISCITRKSDITISPKFFGEYHQITPKKVQYHRITIPCGAPCIIRTLGNYICLGI